MQSSDDNTVCPFVGQSVKRLLFICLVESSRVTACILCRQPALEHNMCEQCQQQLNGGIVYRKTPFTHITSVTMFTSRL